MLTCGASSGFEASTDMRYLWTKEIDLRGSNGWKRSDLTELVGLVASGSLDPVIHEVFPLSEVHRAFAVLDNRDVLGKVLVTPDQVLA